VLVLLACYNGARWIGRQLESILAQQGVDLRIAVRDDGSSDATMAEIARFHGDGRIALWADRQPTGSAAQNFLALIRDNPADDFDFVAFADQDDAWYPDKLATACRKLTDSRCAAGYSSATLATWPNGRTALLGHSARITPADFLFEGAGQGCTYVMCGPFYARMRAFAIDHRPLTEPVRYHDWMVYALARSWGGSWLFDTSPSMCYRQHEQNDTGARWGWAGLLKRFDRIRRGWYRDQLLAIASICAAAAPTNAMVRRWTRMFLAHEDRHRKVRIAIFCLQGARRRRLDNMLIAAAALAGWL
jgi:rhamnosyltransferase